jgi:filamentous hemagglutinin family protein
MKLKSNRWYRNLLFSCLSMGLIILNGSISPAQSQIIPDETLDEESSSVTPNVEINGTPSDRIDGGATRGANLFHSFSEFIVGEGQGAYFTNPMGIENILGRVTGVNPSEILGKLGVIGGNANLFLINPNGIIFGENASLDVGGSFMATTADSIGLGESGSFNATEPQTSNLLSINPSALFFNAMAAQSIVNRSQAANASGETNSVGDPVGLQVAEGKSLALVGGDVFLDGGNLTATGGKIELGSVAGVGRVSLESSENSWLLGYEGVQAFGDIRIEGALADASEGSSKIETGNLVVSDGGQIFTDTFSDEDGGDLNVNATESIELIGTSTNGKPRSGLFARTEGNGNAGNLTIETKNLIVRNSAAVSTLTENNGDGGDLNVNATESIELIGISTNGKTPSGLFARTEGNGNAGNLMIATKNLIIRDGAAVSTRTENDGDGGDLNVNATESIELIGTSAVGTRRSGLFADTKASGNAGNLTIATKNLIVRDGAAVSTLTKNDEDGGDLNVNATESIKLIGISTNGKTPSGLFARTEGNGNAGNLMIATKNLIVRDGAAVSTRTENDGDGGDLNVNATESIELIGTSAVDTRRSGLFADTKASGNAGNINLSTKQLTILDGAAISSESRGIGNAGNLNLDVSGTLLVDNSDITTNSTGDSGNIFINADNLQLSRGSQINTNAANTDGGSIFINTDTLKASNNSDITANAELGNGGLVLINAEDITGMEARDSLTPQTSDITAFSELDPQFNGIVAINGLEILPNIKLPQEPVKGEVVQSCQVTSRDQSVFTVTGKGGMPSTPSEYLRNAAIDTNVASSSASQPNQNITQSKPIIEAQGWIVNERGNVVLTANANNANPVANFSPDASGCSQP